MGNGRLNSVNLVFEFLPSVIVDALDPTEIQRTEDIEPFEVSFWEPEPPLS